MSSDSPTPSAASKGESAPHTSSAPAVNPPLSNNTNLFVGPFATLSKLQTYLPTGTWMTYIVLQSWALSINPNIPPMPPTNCNPHQRAALIFVVVLSTLISTFSSFIKVFVYDTNRMHVLYPFPDLFNVADHVTDPVLGVTFPCRTKEKLYCWPLVREKGDFVYDEKRERLRLLVFKLGVAVHVRRKAWHKRVWDAWFNRGEDDKVPQLSVPTSQNTVLPSVEARFDRREHMVEIDNLSVTVPTLQPRWKNTLMGVLGSKTYLDLHSNVWVHGLVSGLTFLTLALLSTEVCQCLYPSIPDYLPSALQTGMVSLLSVIAALFVTDNTVSLGQPTPQHLSTIITGGSEEIPEHLRSVVEMLVWVRQDDGRKAK
ncbi:hypothetical protein JB92DRAFT_3136522 [Gautieria morchelliformis]|nr:hypothetical protein JB92DRAFT_3136522 [Gautieria morchelliformis]